MFDSSTEESSLHHFDSTEDAKLDCFFIKAQRHDKDRVEFQFAYDGTSDPNTKDFCYDVDFVLFVPKTLGVGDADSIASIRNDFQSYVRLHTHLSNPRLNADVQLLFQDLDRLRREFNREMLQSLAIDFDSFLKSQTKKLREEISQLKKRSGTVDPETLTRFKNELNDIESFIETFRKILENRQLTGKKVQETSLHSMDHDLLIFNEYLSHIYVQRLVEIALVARDLHEDFSPLQEKIKEACKKESQARKIFHLLIDSDSDAEKVEPIDESMYLRRINILKKFFQKSLFVHVSGESSDQKVLMPVYAIAAAVAAFFAIMVQIIQVRRMQDRVGVDSIALITLGIVAYVIKDLLKDNLRKSLYKSGSRFVPDFQKKLFLRRNERTDDIGRIKEYISLSDAQKLSPELKAVRYSVPGGELEEFLNEDVLHFKKRVTLNVEKLSAAADHFPWGLREIVRFKFDRFLISMEDAYKKMHVLSSSGEHRTRYGHRIYQVYAATWIQLRSKDKEASKKVSPVFRAFKINLDKSGVISCQDLDWTLEVTPSLLPTSH